MNKANPARGPPTQPAFNDLNAFNPFNDYLEKPMETLEKLELRKEITDEIREELTRSNGNLITRRILLALAIIILELLFWTVVTASVVKEASIGDGLLTCFWGCYLRGAQAWFIKWFKER